MKKEKTNVLCYLRTFVIVSLIALVLGLISVLLALLDRRWYKRHPGAEEKFAQVDNELTSEGL